MKKKWMIPWLCVASGFMAPLLAADGPVSAAPPVAYSIARLLGGLAFVGAILFAFAWFARRGFFPGMKGGANARLKVLEARSLGQKHAIYVVGYDKQRLLVASSPSGISLLTHLPEAQPGEETNIVSQPTFGEALMQAVGKG